MPSRNSKKLKETIQELQKVQKTFFMGHGIKTNDSKEAYFNSQIQTYQILKNHDQMLILCPFYLITTIPIKNSLLLTTPKL